MALPDYPQKHIRELTLDNNLVPASLLVWEDATSTETKRFQFGAFIILLAQRYFASKDLSNITATDAITFIEQLAKPMGNADDGTGVWKRDSTNATAEGLQRLAAQLVNDGKLRDAGLADKFFDSLTTLDFVKLGRLLSGELIRESSETADGILLSKDAKGLTEEGYQNIHNLNYYDMPDVSGVITIPNAALSKVVRMSLSGPVTRFILPTPATPATFFGQIILLIRRNAYDISSSAMLSSGYVARNNPAGLLTLGTATIEQGIELFAEYDNWTNPTNPTWVWGYSKIGH